MPLDKYSIVYHSLYGKGEVVKITETKIYISFGSKQRIFSYPEAFDKGYLSKFDVPVGTREIVLDVADNISYSTIYEALNEAVGTNYTGWMKGVWPGGKSNLSFWIWFPKLAETKNGQLVSAAFDCVNTISDDWNELIYDDLKDTKYEHNKDFVPSPTLIFAKEPNGGPYIFRGVYLQDLEKSKPKHDVYKRIGTRVRLCGQPADSMEILG